VVCVIKNGLWVFSLVQEKICRKEMGWKWDGDGKEMGRRWEGDGNEMGEIERRGRDG